MMTQTTFEQTMKSLLHRKPFQPFTIELDDGEQWVVGQPEAVFYYMGGTAMYLRADGTFDFVDCDNVKRLVELNPASSV